MIESLINGVEIGLKIGVAAVVVLLCIVLTAAWLGFLSK
jgi:hypothetical protein